MRNIKIIDDITKDGQVTFGDGYAFVDDTAEADAILMRSTDLHGYDPRASEPSRAAGPV